MPDLTYAEALQARLADAERRFAEADARHRRLTDEAVELTRRLDDLRTRGAEIAQRIADLEAQLRSRPKWWEELSDA